MRDFWLPSRQSVRGRGELALQRAVLARAVNDLARGAGDEERWQHLGAWVRRWAVVHRREDLVAWFRSEEEGAGPFAFVPICDALGLDPAAVRQALVERHWMPA